MNEYRTKVLSDKDECMVHVYDTAVKDNDKAFSLLHACNNITSFIHLNWLKINDNHLSSTNCVI